MDPWSPIPHSGLHPQEGELNSDQYIASLESRLSKLKESRNREPTAKDLLEGLSRAKDAEMNNLTKASDDPYVSNYTNTDDAPIENPKIVNAIQRKIQPEKQALSTEELLELIANDELAKVRQQQFTENGTGSKPADQAASQSPV